MCKKYLYPVVLCLVVPPIAAIDLPTSFEDIAILTNLVDPSSMAFAPDGRLFIGERITGHLRVATYDASQQTWALVPTPFYTFDVPAIRHRSSGLRGIAFDPNFISNGFVYVFYMANNPRHNRVVRIRSNPANPNLGESGSEEILLTLPFNNASSSGSHNGGDLIFGQDGKLFITTGDGWNGGDPVQTLSSFTGKVLRINGDGTIPPDNPFYATASGDYRAIYALGLRNPYTIGKHPISGNLYVNDAVGTNKANVYQMVAGGADAGANFGHDGYNGIGQLRGIWKNVSETGGKLITGGAWYPSDGHWPAPYFGNYFCAMWGSNGTSTDGRIVLVKDENNLQVETFATSVGVPPRNKPVMTELGPDNNLYYLLTDYETGMGEVHMIQYTGVPSAAAPIFNPLPGNYEETVQLSMSTPTEGAIIYYSLDGSTPDASHFSFQNPISIDTTTTVSAIAIHDTLAPSPITLGTYTIGPIQNLPPIANAGPDLLAEVNSVVTLNGADSYDPDGSALELSEFWRQVSGSPVTIADADETVANFTPIQVGSYVFSLTVVDIYGDSSVDQSTITVVEEIPDVLDNLIARWSMDEGAGNVIQDLSANANTGILQGNQWSMQSPDQSPYSLSFDGSTSRVDLGNLDLTGNSMTITFWFNATDFGVHDARFISKAADQGNEDHFWMISTLNGSTLRFRLKTNGTTGLLTSQSNLLTTNEWTHVAATYDGTAMKLYVNGIEISSQTKSGNIDSDPAVHAAIGNQPAQAGGGSRPFHGLIDEMRIYGRDLSANEILTVMNSGSGTLPITLINFTAKQIDQHIDVSWSTALEINNAFFALERSNAHSGFTTIYSVAGAGTSSEIHKYFYSDQSPQPGPNYYRLRQQDFDGNVQLSSVREVNFKVEALQAYPNPVSDLVRLSITPKKSNEYLSCLVQSVSGQIVRKDFLHFINGQANLSLTGLPKGVYRFVIPSLGQTTSIVKS